MKKTLILLLLIGMISAAQGSVLNANAMTAQMELHSSELQAGLFGWGKPKYNQNRIQRQNSPKRKNRRNKKLLKKWGLAMIEGKEVSNG
ncbi:hypothetical protein [uncultured Algoriphagus sp.]|uniref:hypothetical protein n=1 Tax=uncultured Algoriphagus sp. TaxID=417365 RepID=UPI0025934818|nr:hypothetical protein [uncultured Algoriphagus sp.]